MNNIILAAVVNLMQYLSMIQSKSAALKVNEVGLLQPNL